MLHQFRRSGRFSTAWLVFLGSVVVLAVLIALLALDPASWFVPRSPHRPLVVYCAAGLRKPVEEAALAYQEAYGVEVQLQYGGSNTLLGQIAVTDRADLYIPADDGYVSIGRDKGLLDESIPLASMRPVLVVRQGNPLKVASLDDIITKKLRVAQANPEAAAIGKLSREALTAVNQWDVFEKRIVVTKPTVNDVASDVALGAVDSGIVWDATLKQIDGLETVPVTAFENVTATLSACVVRSSTQPDVALAFARYLASRDIGAPRFARYGFGQHHLSIGDRWVPVPNLKLFSGAMLKPAIEETVIAFEKREGIRITRVYNGCGILVSQMKASKDVPDVYFACDKEFMDQVQGLFAPAVTVSGNQLVILVKKGNPHHVRRLRDLGKPGLRVGVGHEKQCAMGVITQQTLKEDRSSDVVMKNVRVQSPTGDMLVNQMRTGSLDAAIAYISNAAGCADDLEAVAIDIPCAFAEQPFAIAKQSDHKQLAGRLRDAVLAEESRERFAAYGFTWKGPSGARP